MTLSGILGKLAVTLGETLKVYEDCVRISGDDTAGSNNNADNSEQIYFLIF